MKRIMIILFLLTSAVGYASYCDGPCLCLCQCKCHEVKDGCQEYCWRCALKHHEDCECECHELDNQAGSTSKERNYIFRRRFCSRCADYHGCLEYVLDWAMKKGQLPRKRPYLHPVCDYPNVYLEPSNCEKH